MLKAKLSNVSVSSKSIGHQYSANNVCLAQVEFIHLDQMKTLDLWIAACVSKPVIKRLLSLRPSVNRAEYLYWEQISIHTLENSIVPEKKKKIDAQLRGLHITTDAPIEQSSLTEPSPFISMIACARFLSFVEYVGNEELEKFKVNAYSTDVMTHLKTDLFGAL